MCIRDRYHRNPIAGGIYPVMVAGFHQLRESLPDKFGRTLAGNIKVCLLYTSDAADERSSVDLGGRRIIKKKKSNEHKCINKTEYKQI